MIATSFSRWSGIAALLGGLLAMLCSFGFALTHGATGVNEHKLLVGLSYLDIAKFGVVWYTLVIVGLVGWHRQYGRSSGRVGALGFGIALAGLLLLLVGQILHNWIVDPHRAFDSLWVQGGWMLRVLGILVEAIGMLLYGLAMLRARLGTSAQALPLLNGLGWLFWIVAEVYLSGGTKRATLGWELVSGATLIPYGVSWMLLGYALWASATDQNRHPQYAR